VEFFHSVLEVILKILTQKAVANCDFLIWGH